MHQAVCYNENISIINEVHMMIYALIDTRADDFFMTKFVWGNVQQVANTVLQSCNWIFESIPNKSLEDIENEYECSLDAYRILKKYTTLQVLRSFSIYVEDMEVSVAFSVEGYEAFYDAFNNYKDMREQFNNVQLVAYMDETEENLRQLNDEFRSISSGCNFVSEFRYLQNNGQYTEQKLKIYN